MKIEFFRHNLNQEDKDEVLKVLDSVFLTTGQWTKTFEDKFSTYLKGQHVVGISSCTIGLELTMRYFGIGEGDEVITTPMSFIATANAIETVGAKPVFVDVEESTGNLDAQAVEDAITPCTKAIMPVHLYGQMCDMKKLREIADRHVLKIIEDAAHCIEGERDGVQVGELGDVACFSFYATKNITCGEGGAITTKDQNIYEWFLKARIHGMNKNASERYTKMYQHYDMDALGYKCNMSNVEAALLIHQIDRLDGNHAQRQHIFERYTEGFQDHPNIQVPEVLPNSRHAYHLYTIWIHPQMRDEYLHLLQEAGVGVAVNYRPIHLMAYYKDKYGCKTGDFPIAEEIGARTISLPLYPSLSDDDADFCIETVNQVIQK